MKLVIMTKSTYFVEEDKILSMLFEEGLDSLTSRRQILPHFIWNVFFHFCLLNIIVKSQYISILI